MAKRKRKNVPNELTVNGDHTPPPEENRVSQKPVKATAQGQGNAQTQVGAPVTVEIIIGAYERILHGFTATVRGLNHIPQTSIVDFSDTFLFNAHLSGIRCLALSPKSQDSDKIILATGGSDQTVNLYTLSTSVPLQVASLPPEASTLKPQTAEDAQNREIGTLQHHSGPVNALFFPSKSKLLTGADDNTIAVARSRDWTILSTIKTPVPKVSGRPSGENNANGIIASGVTDFAVHPSMKLMISVGKGESCMRLWNLLTGKKAAVLNFDRQLLRSFHEAKHPISEARKVLWDSTGEAFTVVFDWGCLVYGVDSRVKCVISPSPKTKLHSAQYITIAHESEASSASELLVLSTEDGRLLFHSTSTIPSEPDSPPRQCLPTAEMGGPQQGSIGRIKEFAALRVPDSPVLLFVTGSSDGAVRLWSVESQELEDAVSRGHPATETTAADEQNHVDARRPIGRLLSTYETGSRITCLKAFIMAAQQT